MTAARRAACVAALALWALLGLACARPTVLVVGLDGADWSVLDPLMEGGFVPAIAGLVRRGARADLDCEPAMPASACFCPPVWTTIATGQPYAVHGISTIEQLSSERGAPALWTVLHAHGGTSTLVAMRGTWPPEDSADLVITEPGVDYASYEVFARWPDAPGPRELDAANRTRPVDLLEQLGLLPHLGERLPLWAPIARDRISMQALLRLAPVAQTDFTMVLIHATDKTEHTGWAAVQSDPDAPIDRDAVLALAAAWHGPVVGPAPWSLGSAVSQYLEADAWLGDLLRRVHYEYVVLVSDHGMTRNLGAGLPGQHSIDFPQAHRGILVLRGPDVRRGADLGLVSVFDVAPTVAYLLRLPVADDLPGRFLAEAFHPGAELRLRHVASWSAAAPGA